MFSLLTGVYDSYLAPTQLNVLVVGAPGVGKTTLLERLKVTQFPIRPSKPSSTAPQSPPVLLTPALHHEFTKGGVHAPPDQNTIQSLPHAPSDASITSGTPIATTARTPQVLRLAQPSPVAKKRGFRLSFCPAPERYLKSAQDQEEDIEEEDELPEVANSLTPSTSNSLPLETPAHSSDDRLDNSDDHHDSSEGPMENVPITPEAPKRVRCHSNELSMEELENGVDSIQPRTTSSTHRSSSMESVPLDAAPELPTLLTKSSGTPASVVATKDKSSSPTSQPLLQDKFEEYNLKPKVKMLPLSKIRPTIGTNLGKIEMYGAKCHFFDVGGRLQDLWERYYDDCDAVIFCWQLGNDPEKPHNNDEDDDEEDPFDMSQQQEILNQVRKSIPDDVPFLIFGQVFGNVNVELVDAMYSTDPLLPHYHNNLTVLCCGSAKTGAGVRHAMEWLIPMAKQQQKERIAAKKKLEEKEV